MTQKTKEILYAPEVPRDLFSSSVSVPVYDIEKNATTGEEVVFHLPYNAVEKRWTETGEEKYISHLFQRLREEDFVLWVPQYKGEKLTLLAEKGGKRFLIQVVSDSESERKAWLACENKESYSVVVVREKKVDDKGIITLTFDDAVSSFNFLSL
ncbi:MAG: hypothetical protein ACI4S4_00465 [Candidatus Ornithospirochaeta sp.]